MIPPPEDLSAADFEAIEAAVMETARGRWFLQEFARRRRAEATDEILAVLARIESRAAAREMREAEARRDAARAAAILAESLQKLNAFALDAAPFASLPALTHAPAEPPAGELDRRLSALQALDDLDTAAKLKLFG